MPTNQGKDPKRRLIRPLLWSILAAMAIYVGSVIASDFNAVSESVSQLGFTVWAIVLGLSLANYVLRFIRWEIYLAYLDCRIATLPSLAYYLGGFAFTTSPGKAGEAVRSLYLKRHGVAYVHSLAAFFAERFVDLVAMVLLALVAALTFPQYQWPVLVITVLVIAALSLIHARPVHALLDRYIERLHSNRIRSVGKRFLDLLTSASTLLRFGPLFVGLLLALIAWGAEGIAFHLILESLGVDASIGLAVGIYSVSVLAGALSFIPGGLGSTEAVMVLLLKLVGADTATAVAATLICRLATLWFAVVIGGIVLAVLETSSKAGQRRASDV
ncbi:MAG: flippase-like domain-containing protein [Gammaproteobacteria bacterium]|nr:flippase-like domain-containing protein [Gammaproteobacteria bacterium]